MMINRGLIKNFGVISLDSEVRNLQKEIKVFPWKYFLEKLWGNEFI